MIGTNDWGYWYNQADGSGNINKAMKSTSQYLHIFLYTSMGTSFSHMEFLSLIALIQIFTMPETYLL